MGEGAWGRPSRGDAQTVQDQGGGRAVSSGGSLTGGDELGISSPEVLTIGSSQRGSSTGESSTESCGSQDTRAGERGGGSVGSPRCWRIFYSELRIMPRTVADLAVWADFVLRNTA